MPTGIAEYIDEQIRAAVDHVRMLGEIRRRVDHVQQLDDLLHAPQIAEFVMQHGEQSQPDHLRVPVRFVRADRSQRCAQVETC